MSASPGGFPPPQPPASPGDAARHWVRLAKVTSVVVFTQQRKTVYTGTLAQLESAARSVRTHNLLCGWWGFPFGLVWTPMALASNASAMRKVRSLAAVPPAPGPATPGGVAMRFNPPPGWPAAPAGFTPGPGWQPDPSWPPAPPGWQLWVSDDEPAVTAWPSGQPGGPGTAGPGMPDYAPGS